MLHFDALLVAAISAHVRAVSTQWRNKYTEFQFCNCTLAASVSALKIEISFNQEKYFALYYLCFPSANPASDS